MAKNNTPKNIPIEAGTIFRFNPAVCQWWNSGHYDFLKQPYWIIESAYLRWESDGWWLQVQGMKKPGDNVIF